MPGVNKGDRPKSSVTKGVRRAILAELLGTAVLVAVGLSIVILMFGTGSSIAEIVPNPGVRRLITGFLFGSTGALVAVSWVGKASGAHINPSVTLAFWILGKMDTTRAALYVLAQLLGAVAGGLPLLFWGEMGRSVAFGATVPGAGFSSGAALAGEAAATLLLIVGLFLFIGHKRLAPWTPLLFPFLFAVLVYAEAPVSGTSTNLARSLGPAMIASVWRGWWIYLAGPFIGAALGAALQNVGVFRNLNVEVAKLYHFAHDPHGIFKRPEP